MFQVFLKKDCLTNPTGFPTEPPLQHLWEPGLQPWFVSKNLRTCFDNSPYNKDPTKVSRCVSEFLVQNTFAACVLVAPTKNLLKDNVIICHLAWNFPSFVWKKNPQRNSWADFVFRLFRVPRSTCTKPKTHQKPTFLKCFQVTFNSMIKS